MNAQHEHGPHEGAQSSHQEGGFWQPNANPPVEVRRRTMMEAVAQPERFAEMTLRQYQQWAELDWKAPQDSDAMQKRLAAKLHEEIDLEIPPEYRWLAPGAPREPVAPLLDELGDALWCVNALASNTSYDVSTAVQRRLLQQRVDLPEPTLGAIDELMAGGFQPQLFKPGQVIDDDELLSDDDELDPAVNWPFASLYLTHTASFLRELRGFVAPDPAYVVQEKRSEQIFTECLADTVLFVAYTARQWAGGSLQQVVERNGAKVTQRVQSGRVDKSDGPR